MGKLDDCISENKEKPKTSVIAESTAEKWSQPDNLELIAGLAREGYTHEQLAARMGISISTFRRLRLKKPELDKAIRNSKEVVDYYVESALYRAAIGATSTESKITMVYKGSQLASTIREKTTREQPPNVLACQTWLFNRQRDKWKRNRDTEITTGEDQAINITITRDSVKTVDGGQPTAKKGGT